MKVKENAELLQALEGRNYSGETLQAIIESYEGKRNVHEKEIFLEKLREKNWMIGG